MGYQPAPGRFLLVRDGFYDDPDAVRDRALAMPMPRTAKSPDI